MNKEILELLKQNLNKDRLPEITERLISSFAYYHLWWALGWLVLTLFFGYEFAYMNYSYNKNADPDNSGSMAILIAAILTIWFGFKFIKNIAVFLSPLGKLIQ